MSCHFCSIQGVRVDGGLGNGPSCSSDASFFRISAGGVPAAQSVRQISPPRPTLPPLSEFRGRNTLFAQVLENCRVRVCFAAVFHFFGSLDQRLESVFRLASLEQHPTQTVQVLVSGTSPCTKSLANLYCFGLLEILALLSVEMTQVVVCCSCPETLEYLFKLSLALGVVSLIDVNDRKGLGRTSWTTSSLSPYA